jgi:hypothetical protein
MDVIEGLLRQMRGKLYVSPYRKKMLGTKFEDVHIVKGDINRMIHGIKKLIDGTKCGLEDNTV